jgi:hypothetical protein
VSEQFATNVNELGAACERLDLGIVFGKMDVKVISFAREIPSAPPFAASASSWRF